MKPVECKPPLIIEAGTPVLWSYSSITLGGEEKAGREEGGKITVITGSGNGKPLLLETESRYYW